MADGAMRSVQPEEPRPVKGMDERDERVWASLAHLTMLVNIPTGFLGPVAAFVIWLVNKDRSEKVASQALQSVVYQVAWLVILAAGWAVTGLLMAVLIGFLLVPVMALLTIFPFAYSAYAAYRVSKGDDFRYPFVADLIESL